MKKVKNISNVVVNLVKKGIDFDSAKIIIVSYEKSVNRCILNGEKPLIKHGNRFTKDAMEHAKCIIKLNCHKKTIKEMNMFIDDGLKGYVKIIPINEKEFQKQFMEKYGK